MATVRLESGFEMDSDFQVAWPNNIHAAPASTTELQFYYDGDGIGLRGTFAFVSPRWLGTVREVVIAGERPYPAVVIEANYQLTAADYDFMSNGDIASFMQSILRFDDIIYGNSGSEDLVGFSGNDILIGGPGGDELFGFSGNDTASYANATAGVVVDMLATGFNTGDADNDSYNSIEWLAGSRFNDTFYANDDPNRLLGGAGNDTLVGRLGADRLDGGPGTDTASYDASTSFVVASLLNPRMNTDAAAGDSYVSIENLTGGLQSDRLYGNNLANVIKANIRPNDMGWVDDDRLFGMGGNDQLYGHWGNDQLTGGLGRDRLIGGPMGDRFIFNSAAESSNALRDTIVDFVRAEFDKIVLSAIDARTDIGGNQAFTFRGTAAFTGVAGQLRYQKVGSDSHIQGDTNGDGAADLYIVSSNPVNFVKGDFVL
jgi:serralysin